MAEGRQVDSTDEIKPIVQNTDDSAPDLKTGVKAGPDIIIDD